jgi:benzoyl-CoA reductase/2-hydroxyglutaryl-CoA dehydratase subunit BcrC/BadD/HgdB
MNIPHTWQTVTVQKMYLSELERLSRFLIGLGGESSSDKKLQEIMLRYDSARLALKDLRSALPSRQYSELITEFNRTGKIDVDRQKSVTVPSGVPLALIGGPLMADHLEIFDLIDAAGGYIALDATETGERTLPAPFDRRQMKENPITALVDSYFGSIPDAFQRPNSRLYSWLKHELTVRGIKGIIFRRYLWCDTWNAEAYRMKEWAKLPFFHLDVSDDGTDTVRTLGRLRSFMEILG